MQISDARAIGVESDRKLEIKRNETSLMFMMKGENKTQSRK